MPNISDLLNKLKTSIVQTQTQDIDTKLDQAVKDIVSFKSNSGRNGYIELVKSLISKNADVQLGGMSGGGIFAQSITPTTFGQGSRLMRYKTYMAIISQINYCYRALNVLVDNILSPDDITKVALEIKSKDFLEDETPVASKVKRIKTIIEKLKIEKNLEMVVKTTLLYGDLFCEIGGPQEALSSQTIISEAVNYNLKREKALQEGSLINFNQEIDKTTSVNFTLDLTALTEDAIPLTSTSKQSDGKKDDEKALRNLKLIYHDPQFVVKLQSSMFPVCFGYLVFPVITILPGVRLQDEIVNNICLTIVRNLEKKIPQLDQFKDQDQIKDLIKIMVSRAGYNQGVKIRYVPPDKMTHFMLPTTKYFPYGESIFDSSQYTAKVLIALETALAVQRLSRSTEKRKIAIEIGLPRDARKTIELMKEEFRKRKISLDSFGSVDTIPSMITTFEDVYIPQKDGKPFVDVSSFDEGRVDTRGKVDELKFMRDQLVASLGIPPSFIGIEENLSNKSALSEENILFARTVIVHQKYFTNQVNDLIQKIMNFLDPEAAMTILDEVSVSFPVPKTLQFEREARYMSEVTNLIQSLEAVGVPREYSKKRYLSHIDWEEVKKHNIDQKIDTTLDPAKAAQDQMGGMGGLGMGGMGGGLGMPPTGGMPGTGGGGSIPGY
jgi:hypothetical protein